MGFSNKYKEPDFFQEYRSFLGGFFKASWPVIMTAIFAQLLFIACIFGGIYFLLRAVGYVV